MDLERGKKELKVRMLETKLQQKEIESRFVEKEMKLEQVKEKLDLSLEEEEMERQLKELEIQRLRMKLRLMEQKSKFVEKGMKLEQVKGKLDLSLEEKEKEQQLKELEIQILRMKLELMKQKSKFVEKGMKLQEVKGKVEPSEKETEMEKRRKMLEIQLLEMKLEQKESKSMFLQKRMKREQVKGKLEPWVIEMKLQLEKIKLKQMESKSKGMKSEEMYLKRKKHKLEIELLHMQQMQPRTKFLESGKLEPSAMEMKLEHEKRELEIEILKVKLQQKKSTFEATGINLEEIAGKLEPSSQVEIMELERQNVWLKIRILLEEIAILKAEEMKFMKGLKGGELFLESIKLERKLEKKHLKLQLLDMKEDILTQEKAKFESVVAEMRLQREEEKVDQKKNPEEIRVKPSIVNQEIIVLGGRGENGESLTSVEKYSFPLEMWVTLPPMNTPRSFMSSVLVGSEIVVSGGDTGVEITDTIEILNLDETPLQWIESLARLPVPLAGHQTVVYQGKLIAIGGHVDDGLGNSNEIYEVLLTPPYSTNILSSMSQPRAGHRAELIGDEIFIFGGARNLFELNDDVLVYNLVTEEFRVMENLPYAVHGMATVKRSDMVILLGGVDQNEEELDRVFTYNIQSGENNPLPSMRERRGGCCAKSVMPDSSSGFSSASFDESSGILVALGSLRNINTTEYYDFQDGTWKDMPPLSHSRKHSSIVVSPAMLEFKE